VAAREQREWAARAKLASTTLNAYALALSGAGLIDPVIKGTPFQAPNYAFLLGAFTLHIWALYFAGKGEP